jgi:sugar phosphate isomerase/epimerase
MQLSVFSTALQELDWSGMLRWLQAYEVQYLELGCGGFPGTHHADAHRLLENASLRQAMLADLAAHQITLAALSCHGNPLHPNPAVAQAHDRDLVATVELAHAMQVPVVVCFSGQSGDRPGANQSDAHFSTPNWPVVAWPDDFQTLRTWQWEERLIPYWKTMACRAQELGVQLALEMHGGFAVHNPATLLRLRDACGPALGANLDPSHCWWQGMDPLVSVELLGSAIFHVHLKDTVFNSRAMAENGLLDATPFAQSNQRAWHFALPGDGHGVDFWRQLLGSLYGVNYKGVLSIEHEAPIAPLLGVPQTLRFMRDLAL